ncbi:MAG: hypothetical protein V1784_12100 [bacterium]
MSDFEINVAEIGRTWMVGQDTIIQSRFGPILVYAGFLHDLDTGVPNWPEWDKTLREKIIAPSPVAHDFIFWHRCTAEGRMLTLHDANVVYRDIDRASTSPLRRMCIKWRFWALEHSNYVKHVWNQPGRPEPLPHHVAHMYGMDQHAVALRKVLPTVVVGSNRRLTWLPGGCRTR